MPPIFRTQTARMTKTSRNNYTKYEFSFTAAALRLREMVLVAQHQLEETEMDYVNVLGNGRKKTATTLFSEFKRRVATLTPQQLYLLVHGDLITKKQLALLAICKTHGFIRELVTEVIREKFLVYDYEITEGDYRSFYRRKEELHPELEAITENTASKIRQVTFKILAETGWIDDIKNRVIQPQILDDATLKAIVADNPEWLKVFLMSDMDIERLTVHGTR